MDPLFGLALPQSALVVLLVWLALGFTGAMPGMANFAHLGGLLSGALFGVRPPRRR
jgi:membrane associated rhomboid family serine protease